MAEIAQEVRNNLQQAFQEVAFRANRLREWLELDKILRSLELSFGDFHNEVKAVVNPPHNGDETRMRDRWGRCRETEFIDLQGFFAVVRHINRSSATEAAGSPETSGLPKVNISTLVQLADTVEQVVPQGQSRAELAQRCVQFQRALRGQITDTQRAMQRELTELCEVTLQLKLQF